MTVTQSYSLSLTYASLRMYVSQATPATVSTPRESVLVAPAGDTVTLSPQAAAPAAVEEAVTSPETPVSAPADEPREPAAVDAPAVPQSRAARRAEVLLDALDTDQDGTITKEEFVEGAKALLHRGARHHHRHSRVHGEGHDRAEREGHGAKRLDRRLDRLFERVDAGGDGNVDLAELTAALSKVTREDAPSASPSPEAPATAAAPEPQEPAVAAATLYTSVTVVIAVERYTSVAAMSA